MTLKSEFHKILSQIDQVSLVDWYYYRDLINEYDLPRSKEYPNRAFYKLWEILVEFPDIMPKITSGTLRTCHLAEAPGSFIKVVQDKYPNVNSVAISKPHDPNLETAPVFNKSLINTDTANIILIYGDICSDKVAYDFVENHRKSGFHFITDYGGIDEKCYENKEPMHHQLMFSEAMLSLRLQNIKGSLVFKSFETFTEPTLQLLSFIVKHYERYTVYKPKTSRPTNSERYLLCKGFKGVDVNTLPISINDLPKVIQPYLISKNETLIKAQMEAINKTLYAIKNGIDETEYMTKKRNAFRKFCREYKINP